MTDQLGARADSELAVCPAEMKFDGLGAEEHRRTDLAVRLTFGREKGDPQLLGRQLLARLVARSQPLACGAQLAAGALGPRSRAEPLERLQCGAELISRVATPLRSPEPLTEAQPRPRLVEARLVLGVMAESLEEVLLEGVVFSQEPSDAGRVRESQL